ncbi:hypothetical protein TcCL_Unassigned06348, partial [Trypanosoma cruzi]
ARTPTSTGDGPLSTALKHPPKRTVEARRTSSLGGCTHHCCFCFWVCLELRRYSEQRSVDVWFPTEEICAAFPAESLSFFYFFYFFQFFSYSSFTLLLFLNFFKFIFFFV